MSSTIRTISILLLAASLAGTALASDNVTREHRFDGHSIAALEVTAGVGHIEVRPTEGDTIRVRLEIEGKRHGWLRRRTDVSEFDLDVSRSGDTLKLAFTEEHSSANWFIELPHEPALRIRLGVGEVDAQITGGDLDLNLGVGRADIRAPRSATGPVRVTAGVGKATVRGGVENGSERTLMTESASGHGDGTARLEVKVGVGDVGVALD